MNSLKEIFKSTVLCASMVLVAPIFLGYLLGRMILGSDRAFPGFSQGMALLPGLSGIYLRRAFYRLVLPRCERGCCLYFGTVISHPTAEIGRNVYVGLFCTIGAVTLEDDVLVSSHVSIMNGGAQHGIDRLDIPVREQPGVWSRTTIGRDTWIGEHATVMADVGKHCVIGAGSVVTRPIPDYAIALGVPARVVRFRNPNLDPSQASATGGDATSNRHSEPSRCTSFSL
jgi:acetyltransferase-like isoleucine patch superfamily enzyme